MRVVAAMTADTCREGARRHGCASAAAIALGRACTASLLLATMTKGGERVTVQLLGKGVLGSILADARDGDVRGYVSHPEIALDELAGRARLGPLVGPGIVSVLRDLGLKEPYQGALAIGSGEIDEDLEQYLRESEQLESTLCCDVLLDAGGAVVSAGGVLVQCLPGGDPVAVREARERIGGDALHALLAAGMPSATELARAAVGATPLILDERPLRFACTCTRERVASALLLVGSEELEAMRREDGGAEITCNFCGERYALDEGELSRLIRSLGKA